MWTLRATYKPYIIFEMLPCSVKDSIYITYLCTMWTLRATYKSYIIFEILPC